MPSCTTLNGKIRFGSSLFAYTTDYETFVTVPGVPSRNKVCRNGTVEGVVLRMKNILAFLFALAVLAGAPVPAAAQTSTVPGPAYRISPGDDLEISLHRALS